jgi:hypothetical protein
LVTQLTEAGGDDWFCICIGGCGFEVPTDAVKYVLF